MKRVKELIQDIKENWWIGGLGDWGIGELVSHVEHVERVEAGNGERGMGKEVPNEQVH